MGRPASPSGRTRRGPPSAAGRWSTCGPPPTTLVDNAVRYNRPAGQLAVSTGTAGGRAVLRISNTGREIPPDEARTLLEPFVHGQGTRVRTDGLGLGLSIVRAVALAHRGWIAVTAPPEGGLDVTVELPAATVELPEYPVAARPGNDES
ncbi:ATP-binding protein [Frankia sp. CNm7]|uniref:histidine kinase n=1 Tax=Frankia nepalensis TaxID=1836974 RepID=A0A937RCZ7_9ACTN|nr:ATP-binding protein [Frankia nepalensis]MBL7501445.1 ATP-binding protein [Frankia nepalensis]MBL7509992.1 ATP-binding protein [Frankia nepalensis]MBL7517158.1 ATP-binding protein [Frankia nepalensis]MBL7627997.1 ATP-binding protein [Frankia nepalensis]